MKVAVIGGGAAGFFSAIAVKENYPHAEVSIFEKTSKILSKVKISGGGRCNVTNGCTSIAELSKAYPRGGRYLKKAFQKFNTQHTMDWFECRGVPLIVQEDQCVFPKSQDSQSIIDCFLREVKKHRIKIELSTGVKEIQSQNNSLILHFTKDHQSPEKFDKVIVATGGSPKRSGLTWLESMGHKIEEPVPSLFTFNMPSESIRDLMGVVVNPVSVNIQGTKLKADGPLLITHWGMSGPAILKLSAFGAIILKEKGYSFTTQVNWANEKNNSKVYDYLNSLSKKHPKKLLSNLKPYALPQRMWIYLLEKVALSPAKPWGELGNKSLNVLTNILTNDNYDVSGKTTFKEEFVTCGGISLESIDMNTMQSKVLKNLYFTGELMDIDAITGGYNFQAAWTTAFIAGKLLD